MSSDRTYAGVAPADRAARRRRGLTDAALALFGTLGYRQVTVRQICAEAQVSHRGFYQEFANTEDLLVAVYEQCLDRLEASIVAAATDGELDDVIPAALDAFFRTVEHDRPLGRVVWFEVLGVSPRVDEVYLRRIETLVTLMGTLLDDLHLTAPFAGSQRDVLLRALVGGVSEVARRWVADGCVAPRADLVGPLAALLNVAATGLLDERD